MWHPDRARRRPAQVLWVSVGEEVMKKCNGEGLNAVLYDENTF